jgi:hypothetical protein
MGLLVAASLAGPASAAPNPPGNNTPFDDAPSTEPYPSTTRS